MKKITYLGAALLAVLSARAQYQHSFEGSTEMPAGFTVINNGDPNGWVVYNLGTAAKDGTNIARIGYHATQAHNDYLVFPAIPVTSGLNDRIGFSIRSSSTSYLEPYEVVLSTTGTNEADFNVVLQASEEAASAWTDKRFDLSAYAGQTVYVAVRALGLNEFNLDVDMVINDSNPACMLEVSGSTVVVTPSATSATVTFPEIAGVDSYIIYLTSAAGTEEFTTADANYVIQNLVENTAYSIRIQTVCNGGPGELSSVVNFQTTCGAIVQAGIVQGNEGTTGTAFDSCWRNEQIAGTVAWTGSNGNTGELTAGPAPEGTRVFRRAWNNTAVSNLISPAYNLQQIGGEAYKIGMYLYQRKSTGTVTSQYKISVNTSPTGTGATEIAVLNVVDASIAADGWQYKEFQVPAAFASESNVYFVINSNGSNYATGMDAFVVTLDNGCNRPEELAITSITSNQAVATFAAPTDATTFEYIVSTVNEVSTAVVAVEGTQINLTDLAANTTYYVFVRTNCGDGVYSDWTTSVSFTTACESITALNVVQGNETSVGAAIDNCWTVQQVAGTSNWIGGASGGEITVEAPEGTRIFRKNYNNTSVANLISPAYNLEAIGVDAYKVQMQLFQRNSTNTNTPNASYKVFANTNASLDGAVEMGEILFVDVNLPANGWYVYDFQVPTQFVDASNVHFIIQSNGSYYATAMDAFVVLEDNGCFKPANVAVSGITNNVAQVTWEVQGDNTTFEYAISTTNELPTTGYQTVEGTTLALENLDSAATYYVWVRTACGEDVYSDWSAVVSFSTLCDSIEGIDVIQGNEGTTGSAIDTCWTSVQIDGTTGWIGADQLAGELDFDSGEGTRVFRKVYSSSSVANLVSPVYDLAAIGLETYEVSLKLYRHGSSNVANKYVVYASTSTSTEDAVLLGEVFQRTGEGEVEGWFDYTFQVPAEFATQAAVRFIIHSNGNNYDQGMDAFVVSEGESLSTGNFDVNQFVAYPNPVKDVLTLTSQTTIDAVQILNTLGQVVHTATFNTNDANIDMAHLAQGTYFVKVTAQGATRTVKVVKN